MAYCIEKDKIIGIASMCIYKVISGNKGWIEDVVVDKNSRGKGIGKKLMQKLLEIGKEKELSEILKLAYLLKLSEENIPLVVDWLIRESDMHQIKRFEECLEEL